MKKITGKALSLVLSLALVASSFSATAAFASTKSMSGRVTHTDTSKIFLVNGGKTEAQRESVDLVSGWLSTTLDTNDRAGDVSNVRVGAISHVSGSSLVTGVITNNDDTDVHTAFLKLKSTSASGTEVVSVLYEGDYTDDNGNDYTVKAAKNLTVTVYDENGIVFGENDATAAAALEAGKGLDSLPTLPVTANYKQTLGIYKAVRDIADGNAMAKYEVADVTEATKGIKDSGAYSISISDSTNISYSDLNTTLAGGKGSDKTKPAVDASGNAIVKNNPVLTVGKTVNGVVKDANTANITITVTKLVKDTTTTYKASSDSSDKYTLKTKIEKKVNVNQDYENVMGIAPAANASFDIIKDNGSTKLSYKDSSYTDYIFDFDTTGDVTVDEKTNVKSVVGSIGGTLSIGNANVGSVNMDQLNALSLTDGTVGNVTVGNTDTYANTKSITSTTITVNSGKLGNVDTTDDDDDAVWIYGGTTGDININNTVTLDGQDVDTAINVGAISAKSVDAYSDESTISAKSFTATASDGTFKFEGDAVKVGSIDLNSYNTEVDLGTDSNEFTGTVPAPVNATNGKIYTLNADSNATVSGSLNVDTIDLDESSNVTFTGNVTVDTLDGDGIMTITPGDLYVSGSASGVTLKLAYGSTMTAGTTVFKAASNTVDPEDMICYGFTLTKSEGTNVDTFKIDTLEFAGLQMNKSTSSIAKGYSETFTASAYPTGSSLPDGYTIGWELDGGSSDVFSMTSTGNTATVTVNSIDPTFASENETTLTATLYDADGYAVDSSEYGAATCDITALAVPAATSDTNADFSVAKGSAYTFKITSTTAPAFGVGTAGIFDVTAVGKSGNDYFYKITAVGAVGAKTGIYLNGNKLLVATVAAGSSFTSDTTSNITVKSAYTYKITSSTVPTFSLGTAGVFKYALVGQSGSNYFFKLTSVGAAGAKTGVYVNGTKVNVATVG